MPFARLWLGRPSSFVWQQGPLSRSISQAEGVEQGDPLSPALFCLGLRPALQALQQEIREDLGERILAYLDDVTILASPQRALHLVRRFESHLARHTRLRLNVAKTALWNEAGVAPDGLQGIQSDGRIWFGDQALEPSSRGLVLLGTPFGSPQFIANHLQSLGARHSELLHMLPRVGDTQVAWLLLLYTAAPRAQFALRTLAPGLTREFAVAHDAAVLDTLSALLCAEEPSSLPPAASRVAQLALRHGGLGLRSAALHAPAAFWASWADAFAVLSVREAPLLQGLAQALDSRNLSAGTPSRDLLEATDVLVAAGFRAPVWADLPQLAPVQPADDAEPEVALRGWQRPASRVLDDFALAEHRRSVGPAELALLDSQSGPFAARILTVRPTVPELAVDSALFRVLLLRRLRLPLPLAPARCRCQRPLDVLGDHVAACPRSGTLRQRGGPLERAAARVCREAGAAVATNVLVRDLNLQLQGKMSGALRSLLMDFLCGVARSSQLTPPGVPTHVCWGTPPPQWGHCRRSPCRCPPKQGMHLP